MSLSWISRIAIDCFILLVALLPLVVLKIVDSPHRRGFFCNDEHLKYPVIPIHISDADLCVVAFFFTLLVVTATEGVCLYHRLKSINSRTSTSHQKFARNFPCRSYWAEVYEVYSVFLFGVAVVASIVITGKYFLGKLQPTFLTVCQPDYSQLNCMTVEGTEVLSVYVMIEDSQCRNSDVDAISEARMSFPSGHAALSSYAAVLLEFYIQSRLTWAGGRLLRPFLQAVLIYGAVIVSFQRVIDYRHHPSDVLAGAIIGVLVASLLSIYVAKWFKDNHNATLDSITEDSASDNLSRKTFDRSDYERLVEEI